MNRLPFLLAILLAGCGRGTLSVGGTLWPDDDSSGPDDDSAASDDDSASPDDDDSVLPDDDDSVLPDDDDSALPDDDDFTPPTGCESGPDVAAPALSLVPAMDLEPSLVVEIETPDSSPDMFAVRLGLGSLCPLVGTDMAMMSTGNVANIEALQDYDYPGEGGDTSAGDRATLAMRVVVPASAHSLRYRFLFLSREYPEWVGSEYGDRFEGTIDGTAFSGPIAMDEAGTPISPNAEIALVEGSLAGTGFDPDGATGWLQVDVPVQAGDPIELTFTIYDVADGVWDSAVLLDGFEFRPAAVTTPVAVLLWP